MKANTKSGVRQVVVWVIWFLALLVFVADVGLPRPLPSDGRSCDPFALSSPEPLSGVAVCPERRYLFPWWPRFRWRKWALLHYQAWQRRLGQARRAYQQAVWAARLARLALRGVLSFATVVDWLTRSQLRRQLGALPMLYAVLESLGVRAIINRHCPAGRAEVDHGAVAIVLILNRLTAPRGLYHVADWLTETCLVGALGLPATRFNDDRLRRTLEALAPHLRDIWLDIVHRALIRFDIDISVIFYDLTAFILHGEYAGSQLASFGFAHNTPMNKRKIKDGLDTTQDGNVPLDYGLWPGQKADTATVQDNLERLQSLLAQHGYPNEGILVVGDRANLNDELAVIYDRKHKESGLRYLAGLEARKKEHRKLLCVYPDCYFYRHPLGQEGYYGILCSASFEHEGQRVTHRVLIVLSQPMQRARRRTRARQLRELDRELAPVVSRIGQPRYRTVAQIQTRADTCLRRSPVGHLMRAWTMVAEDGSVQLRWQVDREALLAEMRHDGRYLLATNDASLTPSQMLALYRSKDASEKCFTVCKQDLRVSPLYLHTDERIEAMLLMHMLALLTYNVLERQARRHGLALTTRRIITALESLTVIETHCWDGSVLVRLTPMNDEQARLLQTLAEIVDEMRWPRLRPTLPPVLHGVFQELSPGPPSQGNLVLLLPAA
jgi:transposase